MRWRRRKNGSSGQYRSTRPRSGRFADALFTPPDVIGPTQYRVLRQAQRLRIAIAIGITVVFALPFLDLSWTERLGAIIPVVTYVFLSVLIERVAENSRFATQVVNPLLGLAAVFLLSMVLPFSMVPALLTYVLGVMFYTLIGGLGVGLWTSAVAVPLALIANQHAGNERLNAAAMLTFVGYIFATAFLLDILTRERRRAAFGLDRLHEAMRSMSSSPNLGATLASVIDVIDDAVGSTATEILLRQGDHLVLAAPGDYMQWDPGWTEEQVESYTRRELDLRDTSPVGVAAALGEVVVIPDVNFDARFPHWCDEWRGSFADREISSLIVVPLQLGPEIIGVLSVCFEWTGALGVEELELLESYAEQVAIVIARAQAYEQEHEAARRLADADRAKSEFLAMVSHELRTPLTAAKGFVDTVLLHWDRLDDERRRELLVRASGNADELSRLVSQLLDFSRMDADRIEVRPQRCNLRDLVDALATDMGQVLDHNEVHVNVPDLAVSVDPAAFGQVLQNLLTNAAKFSPNGASIDVTARSAGDEVVISVRDTGVGIPIEEQDKIFDRFYQAKNSDTSRRGAGIGLSIVRRYVEMHGGRVWVESTPGSGSEFFFTLPLAGGESDTGELPARRDERAAS